MFSQAKAATVTKILDPADHANTTAATSSYFAVSEYEGPLLFVQQVGVVTAGTIAGKIQHADDDSGTNVADVTGATFTSAGTSTDNVAQGIVVQSGGLKPYIRYVGTIATGPAVVGVTMVGVKKYV